MCEYCQSSYLKDQVDEHNRCIGLSNIDSYLIQLVQRGGKSQCINSRPGGAISLVHDFCESDRLGGFNEIGNQQDQVCTPKLETSGHTFT